MFTTMLYEIFVVIIHQMTDVVSTNRVRGLDAVGWDVAMVFEAVINHIFGAVVTGSFVITVLAKVMVEADAVGQAVLVYEIHKLIHGLCPNDFYVSAYRREYQPIRPGVERIAAVIQPEKGFH